ncbi:hypothetical protein BLNAU_6295 [Blattamonas nauphoetae]|uniref:Uncharacterized protein n=1 Tax=Blattamonas nauphoetae TaxID=2049346 RepID=A0ABQ9Y4X8_9EUKA|nr:hypothetical protein BLNAU_6295 [Blattamonas nauphoetae]
MYPATHQPTAKRINTLPSTITSFPPRFPWQGNSSFVSHSQRQQTSLNDSPQSSPDKSNATPVTRIQMYSMDSKHDVPDEENEAEMVLTEKQEKKRRKEEKRQRKEEKRKRREEETRINLERQKLKDEEQGRRERDKQHQESRKMKEEERKRKEQEHLRQQEEEEKQQRIRQMEEEARKDEERQKVNTIRKAITRTEDEITSIKREVTELKEKVEEEMKKKEKREEMELRAKQDKEKVKKEEQELTAQIALLSEQIQQEQAKLAHRTQERKEKGILEIELEQALTMKETVSQEIGRVNTKIQELDKETSLLEEECNHLLLVKHEKEKEKLQAWSRWSRLKVENAELMRRVHNTTEILRETEGAWHERNEWYTRVILEDAEAEEKNETGSEPKSRRKRDKGQKS